jgi:hypothetical protein
VSHVCHPAVVLHDGNHLLVGAGMPKKSIEERAAASFASDEVAEAKEYIRAILESWKDISRALVRTTALILFVINIFELLGY